MSAFPAWWQELEKLYSTGLELDAGDQARTACWRPLGLKQCQETHAEASGLQEELGRGPVHVGCTWGIEVTERLWEGSVPKGKLCSARRGTRAGLEDFRGQGKDISAFISALHLQTVAAHPDRGVPMVITQAHTLDG